MFFMPALDATVCVLSSTVTAGVNRASHITSRLQFMTEAKIHSKIVQEICQIFITLFWWENADVQQLLSIMKVIQLQCNTFFLKLVLNKNWFSDLRSDSAVPQGKAVPGPVWRTSVAVSGAVSELALFELVCASVWQLPERKRWIINEFGIEREKEGNTEREIPIESVVCLQGSQ